MSSFPINVFNAGEFSFCLKCNHHFHVRDGCKLYLFELEDDLNPQSSERAFPKKIDPSPGHSFKVATLKISEFIEQVRSTLQISSMQGTVAYRCYANKVVEGDSLTYVIEEFCLDSFNSLRWHSCKPQDPPLPKAPRVALL